MLERNFFLGFIRIHILYHASKAPVYGIELIEELLRHGYALSPGTLYPLLHRLESEGFLTSGYRTVAGKRRRYYAITETGGATLIAAKKQVAELAREVME